MATKTIRCSNCNKYLDPINTPQVCPNCVSDSKSVAISVHENISIKTKETIHLKSIREFYENNHVLLAVVVLITICSPVFGFFLIGMPGVILGLILGIISFYLGPHAVFKVREIKEVTK